MPKFSILAEQYLNHAVRKCFVLLLFLVPAFTHAQYKGLLSESFFARQPSARAEAMGKAYTSIDGDLNSVFFNPAGISSIKGIEMNASYTPPSFYLTEGYYTYFAAGVKVNDYLRLAVSQYQFNLGEAKIYTKNNTLTIGAEPVKNLYIGLNANLLVYETGVIGDVKAFYLDLGAIKKFEFLKKETSAHSVNIGASVSNFTMSVFTFEKSKYESVSELPVTGRFAVNYQFLFDKKLIRPEVETLRILIQGEYQNVFNSDFYSAYRTGGEILLFEILALRLGYYKQEENDYRLPLENYDEISAVTYGLGLQLPIHKLTNLPLNIRFDYASMPQEPYSKIYTDFDNFNTYSLRLNWLFKKKDKGQKIKHSDDK